MSAPRPSPIVCDVGDLAADAVAVDTLARLQVTARRLGLEIRLCHASSELRDLLAFVGLRDVLGVEAGGEAESGNSFSVSRKKLSSTIRPADSSSTCSAHGS